MTGKMLIEKYAIITIIKKLYNKNLKIPCLLIKAGKEYIDF